MKKTLINLYGYKGFLVDDNKNKKIQAGYENAQNK